jgi:hypothetical protein
MHRRLFVATTAGAALAGLPGHGPSAIADERWRRHDPNSTIRVDHGRWGDLLRDGLQMAPDGIARFAYRAVGREQRLQLDGYLRRMAATGVERLRRAEQAAFWINLYNAALVRLVLMHPPVSSVREIASGAPGLLGPGPWTARLVEVDGDWLSLDDILNGILRPLWGDPRILYAVNMAALGSPDLRAFEAADLDKSLDQAAMTFIEHPRAVSIAADGQLRVSSLFRWFAADFGGTDRGIIRHLMGYAAPDLAMQLQGHGRIASDAFDWQLNDVASAG